MTNLYQKVVPRWHGIVSEMKHQVSKGDLCIWCGGHWRNTPLKTQHCQSISSSQAPKFSDFAISNGCCANILCLAVCGKEDQHPASYSQQLWTWYGPQRTWEKNSILNQNGLEQSCIKTCANMFTTAIFTPHKAEMWGSQAEKAALLRARTGRKFSKFWIEQSVKQRTEFHELIHLNHPLVSIRSHIPPIIPTFYSRKLLKFVCPIHCWASRGPLPLGCQCSIRRTQRSRGRLMMY